MKNWLVKSACMKGLLAAVLLASCGDGFFAAPAAKAPASLALSYSIAAADPAAAFDKADRIRVRVTAPGFALDTILPFTPAAETRVRLALAVPEGTTQTYQVTFELRRGTDVLFTGTTTAMLANGKTTAAEVRLAPVATTVTFTSGPVLLTAIGDTGTFVVTARFATGDTVIAPLVSWSSTNPAVATIDASGRVTATGEGTTQIRATIGAVSTALLSLTVAGVVTSVDVSNPLDTLTSGATRTFTAVVRDRRGNVLNRTVAWSSSNPAVATVGSATGVVTGVNAGSATINATAAGVTGGANVTVKPGAVAAVSVSPASKTLLPGEAQQFAAVARDANGNVVVITPVWSVVAGGGTISISGLFTAGTTPGIFTNTVTATIGNVSGTASVTVSAGPLATIVVTPSPVTIGIGLTQQFTAVGRDASGNVLAITPVWSVVAGGGAISSSGLFTAGTTADTFANTVVATSGAISGRATVTVSPGPLATIVVTPNPNTMGIGATEQFTAVGRDAGGNPVAITPVWSVANSGGTISTTGLFTAGTIAGTFANTVRASSGNISGTATVTVEPGSLATIAVTPNPASMGIGATQQFTAVGRDANSNVVAITPVWSVVNGGGTINPATGLFTAGTISGTFNNTVRATTGNISGTATVTVTPGPLATIVVTPNPDSVSVNATRQFTATGRDANGNVVAITPVWSVVNGGGSISSTGLFTAGQTRGTFNNTVQATSGAISGAATVVVTPGPLASIVVSPNPVSMASGTTQQFTATGRDANGNVVAITPVWSVVNGGGTINSSTGQFTASTAGTFNNTVQATSGGISGTATVTVTPGALATITVAPNPASIRASGAMSTSTMQFTAAGRDAAGNSVSITPVWSVVNGGGFIDSNTGLFTAGQTPGTFNNTVKATSGTISGTATVTVTP